MSMPPTTREALRAALVELGRATTAELAEYLNMGQEAVKKSLQFWRRRKECKPPRICEWQHPPAGRMIVVWELNPEGKRDARKPKALTPVERNRTFRQRNVAIVTARRRGVTPSPFQGLL